MKDEIKWVVAQPLIGGMSIGFENIFGSVPKAIITSGVPNDLHYIRYMNITRGLDIPVINMDGTYAEFTSSEDERIFNEIKQSGVDVMMHVAICSGLSMLNTSESGDCKRCSKDNIQNKNMYTLNALGERLGAKVIAYENAPGAYTKSGAEVIEEVKSRMSNYSTHLLCTNALEHGTPQSRKRTFISFFKDTNPPLMGYESKDLIELSEYLSMISEDAVDNDLFVTGTSEITDVFYEFCLWYSESDTFLEAMCKILPNKTTATALQMISVIGFDSAIEYFTQKKDESREDVQINRYTRGIRLSEHCKKKIESGKGYWDSSAYLANKGKYVNAVISKNIHRVIHPTEERHLSIRELLHLMGHPDNFDMIDSLKNWNHISQNVPVKSAEYFAKQLKAYLNNELQISSNTFVKQNNTKKCSDTKEIHKIKEW